ncbi:MAG: tetratricopeptide repeat protein [Usitatibacter sp.]
MRFAPVMASVSELQGQAVAAHQAGRWEEAEARYRDLLALHEDHPGLLNNLGLVLVGQRRYADAVTHFERSLAVRPRDAKVLVALSNALNFCNRPADAIARCDEILAAEPQNTDARHNKAVALRALNRHEEAIAVLESLLAQDAGDGDAEYNLALSRLVTGDFVAGWRHYEARWRGSRPQPVPPPAGLAEWRPGDRLAGEAFLVQAEQGLGDTLHFIRFVPALAARCAQLRVQVQPALVDLVRRHFPGVSVEALGAPLPPGAPHKRIGLLSLPLALGLTDESAWAGEGAYLHADPVRVAAWDARLPEGGRLRVGIAWRGSPGHRHDHNRSLAVETLAPLLEALQAAQASVFTLQKDATPREREWLARFRNVQVLDSEIDGFEPTAAVIARLDHVVSVDTAMAHLAGGMGRPATVLLAFSPDWRWRLGRDTSAFYPSLRLVRQRAIGDWSHPIEQLIAGAARWERAP